MSTGVDSLSIEILLYINTFTPLPDLTLYSLSLLSRFSPHPWHSPISPPSLSS